ncbi:MAG: (d)CMP kinase [Clostridiales bacterium]|nr:(d)CMP kinase [Clostridiales bacterium]
MKTYIIAIDGPAGAGKSTVCSDVAKELGILHLDTGATYRTLALGLLREGVDVTNEKEVTSVLDKIEISIDFVGGKQLMYLNGEDVTSLIRTNEISQAASASSVIGSVREKLVQLQRDTAKKLSMIVDGRDVGTCVFPDAQYKFYLTADTRERARRRAKQLLEQGIECDFDELVAEIEERDHRDMNRPISPLRRAEDAILIDCTDMTQQEVVQTLLRSVKVE